MSKLLHNIRNYFREDKMKFQIKNTAQESGYGEIPQVNPLRWVMLYRTGDDVFETQTTDIKCKDFFNDTLAFHKHGKNFNMYGYAANKKKNEEGIYFLLKHIGDFASFASNIEVLNKKLREQLKCELSFWQQSEKEVVMLLPNPVWDSTWKLSLVTMLIRCCNYGYRYEQWDDFYRTDAPLNQQERSFDIRAKANTQAWGFIVPEKYQKYWWFNGSEYNSEKYPEMIGGTIHNNGCVSWSMYLPCVKTDKSSVLAA